MDPKNGLGKLEIILRIHLRKVQGNGTKNRQAHGAREEEVGGIREKVITLELGT